MNKILNPFLIYGYENPDYFCDRVAETAALISALRNGRNVTLMSPRRMGKTGLIMNSFYQIRKEDENARCFYLDVFSTKNISDFVSLLGKTVMGQLDSSLQKITNTFVDIFRSSKLVFTVDPISGVPQVSLNFNPQEAENTLSEIFNYLQRSEKECFIAIDEFQQVAEYPEQGFEALLRSYVQFCPNVHFVFSGSKQHLMSRIFDEPSRPFYRSTEKMQLYPLDQTAYCTFAQKHLSSNNILLTSDIFAEIYSQLSGHTWYIQYLLNKIYELAPEVVNQQAIQEALRRILLSETDTYQRLYDGLTRNQAQLLVAIAKEVNVVSINGNTFMKKYNLKGTSSINKALQRLVDKEFVFKDKNGCSVYDRYMALWLKNI